MTEIKCQMCGGQMRQAVQGSGNYLGIALALLVFAAGLFLTFTGIGALLGLPALFCFVFIGGRRRKVWKCEACGYLVERG